MLQFLISVWLFAAVVGVRGGVHVWKRAVNKAPSFRRRFGLKRLQLDRLSGMEAIPIIVNYSVLPPIQIAQSFLIGLVLATMFAYIVGFPVLCIVYIQDALMSSKAA